MPARFVTLDVFTDRAFAGNPLAVVPDARGLDDGLMQAIAREFGLSETTFVLPPTTPRAVRRVRIFTPERELPFAGHPTLGTAVALVEGGYVPTAGDDTTFTFELAAGPTAVRVQRAGPGHRARLTAPQAPVFGPETAPVRVAAALGLAPTAIDTTAHAPVDVGTGVDYVVVRLADLDALAGAAPQPAAWAALATPAAAHGMAVYVPTGADSLRVRVFAPGAGVPEDPATGSAATALGALLARLDPRPDGRLAWTLTQGVELGRPARLDVEVDKAEGAITAVHVAGAAVIVGEGTLRLPAST